MPEGGGQLPGQGGGVEQVGSLGLPGARVFRRFGDMWLDNNKLRLHLGPHYHSVYIVPLV